MLERSVVTVLTPPHLDTTCPSPATVRVAVTGEVDMATPTVLRDRLLDVLDGHGPSVLEVDLAGVTFLDCPGIHDAAVRCGGCRLSGAAMVGPDWRRWSLAVTNA